MTLLQAVIGFAVTILIVVFVVGLMVFMWDNEK